ncbi:hypothetical protein RhoFasGS6_03920 [Rhodococcus fascians]|nr:hypothetical protein [Rhodococcus fascians]
MSELIVAPDIEAALVQHLNAQFAVRSVGTQFVCEAVTEVPDPRPDRLVRVTHAGGPRRNRITDSPVVIFEAWAPTKPAASQLGRLTEALVLATDGTWIGTPPVWIEGAASSGGISYFPDPDTSLPRYQFTLQLFTNCEVQ